MCAIAGMIGFDQKDSIINRMLDTMARRGPDDQGIYQSKACTLLHTRLAIIDPAGGKQPMELDAAGEHYTLVYNGELYNTGELRRELVSLGHHFEGHSDTEVVLHSYVQWGSECLKRFNGIFAFAIWEERRSRLFLARDRIGVKPLFYYQAPNGIIFSSEIKTILAHDDVRPVLDAEGAAEVLLLGPGRTPGCGIFRGISELEPGHYAQFEDNTLTIRQYWKLMDREHRESFEDTVAYVQFLVTDAIRRQMISDVPIGTFLSGGLDSSIITAICAQEYLKDGRTLDTFSVDYLNNAQYFTPGKFQPNSDEAYIRMMTEAVNTNHHWTILKPEDLVQALEDATTARDLPGMADVDFSLLAFCRDIRPHVKVALSGECADEIFGGYPWYRDPEIRDSDGFPWAQNTLQRVDMLMPAITRSMNASDYVHDRYQETCRNSDILPGTSAQERRMKEMVNLNFRWFMQTLLDRKDRMSMYSGLEVRVPFCDYRIAEYLYGVPWKYKDFQNQEKGLLRHAMQDLLPEQVLWRKKSPYPKTHDPRYQALVYERLAKLLDTPAAPIFYMVDRSKVRSIMEEDMVWPWYGQLMKGPQTAAFLLQIDYWLRAYRIDFSF